MDDYGRFIELQSTLIEESNKRLQNLSDRRDEIQKEIIDVKKRIDELFQLEE